MRFTYTLLWHLGEAVKSTTWQHTSAPPPSLSATAAATAAAAVSANITAAKNITPVPLFPGSSDLLFMPVYRFESDLNRTVDGSWPAGGAPAKMEQWMVVDSAAAALKPATYLPEGQYPDGFYNIRVRAAGWLVGAGLVTASCGCQLAICVGQF